MRKLSLLIILFSIARITSSQSCLPEGILFTSQAQIDSFQLNYPGCTCIEGNVHIQGADISELEGLGVLDSIMGNLTIGSAWKSSNPNLTDLDGIENLNYIGGGMVICNNENLVSITGLSGLEKICGPVRIIANPINSLFGLDGIDTIHGFELQANDELTNMSGLNNLELIDGYFFMTSNNGLINLTGLGNLTRVTNSFIIYDHSALTSLAGLENLQLAGDIDISGNISLSSLEGLNGLDSILYDLSIEWNDELVSLEALSNLIFLGGSLYIINNMYLTSLGGLEGLDSIGGVLSIHNNDELTSLSGLEGLNSLGGVIRVLNNDGLISLTGLENIDPGSIIDIWIGGNQNLSECDISNLCTYLSAPNGIVAISNNNNGCNNPHEIAEACGITLQCLPYGNYYFLSQADLDSFPSYYPGCRNLQGTVWIGGEDISSLDSLNGVDTINGSLFICDNPVLTSLSGLHNLKTITGSLLLGYYGHSGNPGLSNMVGFNNLNTVGEGMLINENSGLNSFIGFDSLQYIGGRLEIFQNQSLKNLDGFSALHSVGSFEIGGNDSLVNLEGFKNLVHADGGIEFAYNQLLTSLDGIENIDPYNLELIQIIHNPSLSKCEVSSVCDYLLITGSNVTIGYNAPGCNSPEEVEEACEVGLEDDSQVSRLFLLYPNPASDELMIEIINPLRQNEITIHDISGRLVVRKSIYAKTTSIDINSFPCGMYLVRLRRDTGISVQKFVKF